MDLITGRDPRTGRSIEVEIENSRIACIHEGANDETAWLSPGLIDLQINGYGGLDFNAEGLTPQVVIDLARSVLGTGVTTFLPTIITQSEERIAVALRAIAMARRMHRLVAHMIPGIHIEGPSISSEDGPRGAHPREHIRPPSIDEFERWQEASGGLVRLVTLSPHFKGSASYITALAARGVHVSIGHTHCTADEVRAAVDSGAALSTHLGNGVADRLPRHPNMIWAQLANDRLTAMLIADGHHLPADTLQVMLRAKGIDRAILVSDAVALAGMGAGVYQTAIGGDVELSKQGRLSLRGTRYLAGAALPLKDGVANMVRNGTSLGDALKLATENPGQLVKGRGTLQVGADADLIRFHIDDQGSLVMEKQLVQGTEWI